MNFSLQIQFKNLIQSNPIFLLRGLIWIKRVNRINRPNNFNVDDDSYNWKTTYLPKKGLTEIYFIGKILMNTNIDLIKLLSNAAGCENMNNFCSYGLLFIYEQRHILRTIT